MGYILKNDFLSVITADDLNGLTNSDDKVWAAAEVSALEEIKSYLRHRYDVSAEFDIAPHVQSETYQEGDRVIVQLPTEPDTQGVYVAKQDVPVNTAISDTAFWQKSDGRNQKLVNVCIIIILYENYTRLNGTEIPNWLQLRYDGGDVRQMGGVIGYLKQIQKGTVQPDLALRSNVADGTDQSGNNIAVGTASNTIDRNTTI